MKTLSEKPLKLDPKKYGAQIDTFKFYSESMRDLYKQLVDIVHSDQNIILVGEQGAGKRYFSKLIHSLSAYSEGPFRELYCNTIEEIIQEKRGLKRERTLPGSDHDQSCEDFGLDFLSGGTLYFKSFEELSHLNKILLVKLLHNAQEMIAATAKNRKFRLVISINKTEYTKFVEKPFWAELLDKLSPIIIQIPALRERCEDIPLLIDQFLIDFALKNNSAVNAITPHAVYKCISYHWPGNVRQLKNAIEHASTSVPAGSVINASHLPFSIDWKSPYSHLNVNMEQTKSFIRAENMLLREVMTNSNLSDQELEKFQQEFRSPFTNRTIFLS